MHALRYGSLGERRRHENFVGPIDRPDVSMPMDYFVLTVHGPDGVTVVDTRSSAVVGVRRGRTTLTPVERLLRDVGAEPASVRRVVLMHLHYDHAGGVDLFADADLVVQADELAFVSDAVMRHNIVGAFYKCREIAAILDADRAGPSGVSTGASNWPPASNCTASADTPAAPK